MLKFVDYSLENLKKYAPLIKKSPLMCNDISLGSFFMWYSKNNLQFTSYNNTFIAKMQFGDETAFSFPFGEDVDGALDALFDYACENNLPFMFYGISEDVLKTIKSHKRFSNILANYNRKWSDYIYSFEEMANFTGKKFSGQRNHINRFKKTYGTPDFRPITPDDYDKIHQMLDLYAENLGSSKMEISEFKKTYQLLEHFKEFNMYGGVLYVDSKVAAFTIGEIVGDMLIIHVEKALKEYTGVYPTTFNCFVNYIKSILDKPPQFVNREDDAGDLGLRQSKLQYQPVCVLNKYMVKINSPVAKISQIPEISFDGGVLTPILETDKENYFNLCTDIENNKYWGYDYEEDYGNAKIDENTFYDSQSYDYSLGTSINFAIRTSRDGELIGETIIYRFTMNSYAEIGCRISKEYQGKGLGKKAFCKTADFAQEVLGVKPIARCFRENTPSYHMICASGFHKTHEDEKFYYFKR